jgi:hypothetical protein
MANGRRTLGFQSSALVALVLASRGLVNQANMRMNLMFLRSKLPNDRVECRVPLNDIRQMICVQPDQARKRYHELRQGIEHF